MLKKLALVFSYTFILFASLQLISSITFAEDNRENQLKIQDIKISNKVLAGAEIELPPKHLTAFAQYIDFEDLKIKLFSSSFLDLLLKSRQYLDAADQITKDFILYHPEALDQLPKNVSEQIQFSKRPTANESIKQSPIYLNSNTNSQSNSQSRPQANSEHQQINKLSFETKEPQNEDSMQTSDSSLRGFEVYYYQEYWQNINDNWNKLPSIFRLGSVNWNELSLNARSQLLSLIYQVYTNSSNTSPHLFDFKWSNLTAQNIFNEFYITRDGKNITEFHTVNPQSFETFQLHLKRFFDFINQSFRLKQNANIRYNDIGIDVHISAPEWQKHKDTPELEKLALKLQAYLILKALTYGDFSTIVPQNQKAPNQRINPQSQERWISQNLQYSKNPHKSGLVQISKYGIEFKYFPSGILTDLEFFFKLASVDISSAEQLIQLEIKKIHQSHNAAKIIDVALHLFADVYVQNVSNFVWRDYPLTDEQALLLAQNIANSPSSDFYNSILTQKELSSSEVLVIQKILGIYLDNIRFKSRQGLLSSPEILKLSAMYVKAFQRGYRDYAFEDHLKNIIELDFREHLNPLYFSIHFYHIIQRLNQNSSNGSNDTETYFLNFLREQFYKNLYSARQNARMISKPELLISLSFLLNMDPNLDLNWIQKSQKSNLLDLDFSRYSFIPKIIQDRVASFLKLSASTSTTSPQQTLFDIGAMKKSYLASHQADLWAQSKTNSESQNTHPSNALAKGIPQRSNYFTCFELLKKENQARSGILGTALSTIRRDRSL